MPSYTVRPGDNLAAIAARYGTTVRALQQANNIPNPNLIQAGRTLTIPGTRDDFVPATPPAEGPRLSAQTAGAMTVPDFAHGGTAYLSPQVVDAIQKNFPQDQWNIAYHIVAAESKGNPSAKNPTGGERGIFQIHPVHHRAGINDTTLQDPYVNAREARRLFDQNRAAGGDGWGFRTSNPWAVAPAVGRGLGLRS
jgi:LysM repeat protein